MEYLPSAIRPLVKRLETQQIPREEITSIVFVVRLIDSLHAGFYATFLSESLTEELCEKLSIQDLKVEMNVFTIRWSFRQGAVAVTHTIAFDYDCQALNVLSKIGDGVLRDRLTTSEGLNLIRQFELGKNFSRSERCYRDFPGRALILPFMACTCTTVYFGGTYHDLYFSAVTGLVCGLLAWFCSLQPGLFGVIDILVSIATAMLSVMAIAVMPQSTCFSAQVLGNLYWFLYGTAFVLSIYEIINGQVMTGVARFFLATVRSYGLAFGVLIGVWFSAYTPERWEAITRPCAAADSQIPDIYYLILFPINAVACLMQFRVSLRHFVVCFLVQTVAYGSQYVLANVWKQPDFVSNLVPAFFCTVSAHVFVAIAYRLRVSNLNVSQDAYRHKKDDDDVGVTMVEDSVNDAEMGTEKNDEDYNKSDLVPASEALAVTPLLESIDKDCNNALVPTTQAQKEGRDSGQRTDYFKAGWATRYGETGYSQTDRLEFQRSDIWFCVLPALYLLVPGSKLLTVAFDSILETLQNETEGESVNLGNLTAFANALFIISLGQVIGIRLGFAFLWAITEIKILLKGYFCQ